MTTRSWTYLFLCIFFVLFSFSLFTHPFEIPDEQSHYATVHYLASEKQMPTLTKKSNLSLEEEKVEYLLGIMSEGNNKYSHHPEFRLEAGVGVTGKFEQEIISLNTDTNRNTYTIHQAAIYPPLYYYLATPFYQLVESHDILLRLFVTRISSVLITTLTVIASFKIGHLIWGKLAYGYLLSLIALFFPMTTYIGSGVSSDNLHNLFFTVFIYQLLKLLKSDWTAKDAWMTGLIIGLDILTKPQAYIMLPILGVAFLLKGKSLFAPKSLKNLGIVLGIFLTTSILYRQPQYLDTATGLVTGTMSYTGLANFLDFTKHYLDLFTGPVIVWYWGVFKWFGVVLPRPFWWIANRVVIVAVIGLTISIWRSLKKSKIFAVKSTVFLISANLIYLSALLWFDWQFYQQIGRSLGFQPRYLMPLLSAQLALILSGVLGFARTKKSKIYIATLTILMFIGLHFASLFTQLSSYYDLHNFQVFLDQLSQYKPFYAKGPWWYLWIPLYFVAIISLLKTTFKELKKS